MTPLRLFTLAALLLYTSPSALAGTNVGGPPEPDKDKCGGTQSPGNSSLTWNIHVGLARNQKATSFTAFAQTAFENNGNLPNFNDLFGRVFSASPLQQRQVSVEIFQLQLSAATFHPSVLFVQSEALFEMLKKPAAGGFPEFIHQIVTDDAFTLIDLLPAPESGWRLRVWKKNAIAPAVLTKSGSYYVTAGFEALPHALTDVTFKRPAEDSGDDTLLYLQNETTGVSGTRTITSEIVQTLDGDDKPATVVSKVFSGAGTGGPLLSQEDLTYTDRGTKGWDYSIARVIRTSSVDAAGTAGGLVVTGSTLENYDDFSTTTTGGLLGMKRLVSLTEAYDVPGQSPQTTSYSYIDTPGNATTHGRLATSTKPDGSWISMEYSMGSSSPVSVVTEYSGWKDLTSTQKANARKTVTTVSATSSTVETTVAGQLVSKSKSTLTPGSSEILITSEQWDGEDWHATTTGYFPDSALAPNTGRIKWIENADGTATTYAYAMVDEELVVTERKGAGSRSAITAGTEVKTTYNLGNQPIAQTTKDIASGLDTEGWVTDLTYNGGFDPMGRPIKRIYNADVNDYDITQHACCGLEFSRDRMGATTGYSRDGLKRVYKVVTKASSASPEVTTFTTANGLTTTRTRSIGGQSLFLGSRTLSIDGLTRSDTGPSRKSTLVADRPVTTTVIAHSAAGDTETTTYADLSTSVTASYLDGRIKSVSGSAVPDMTYDYATHTENGGGEKTITTASGLVTSTFKDLLDRPLKTVSGATGTTIFAYHPFDAGTGSRGKLLSVTDADNVAIAYGYDNEGGRTTETRSIPIATGTATQVTTTTRDVVADATLHGTALGVSFRETQTVESTGIAAVITSRSFQAVTRLVSGSISLGRETLNIRTRPDASGVATHSTTNPDGTRSVRTTTHGLTTSVQAQSTTSAVINSTGYNYDTLQRPLAVTDSRTGTTTYDVDADGQADVTESGQPLAVKTPANHITLTEFDLMGRVIKITLPDTTVKHTAYHPTGRVKVTWGSQTYPTWNVYDEQGRQTHLHTWKTAPTLDPAVIPANPPAGSEVTTWIHGGTTGHLDRKEYADTKGTEYFYTAAGRLEIRTWARGVTTTYGYTHGLMTSTDYSDSTPDVLITYEPLGRQSTVTQADQSQIAYTYDPATLAIDTETIRYDLDHNGSYEFTRVLDRKPTDLGRDKGWELKDGTTVENQVTYGYHATDGRLATVLGEGDVSSPQTFSYDYLPDSNLIETVTGPVHTVTNTWEPNRDVLDTKENKVGTDIVSKYDYLVDGIGQRKEVATSGTAFPAMPSWLWDYDSLGQVIAADSSVSTSDRSYQYDTIGNRKKSANSLTLPGTDNYASNSLNQYTAVDALSPTYDFDGNATAYPLPVAPTALSVLGWDGENRQVSSTVGTTTTYLYDAQSRRIAKSTGGSSVIYLYDAWNSVAEYSQSAPTASAVLSKTRLWGMDLTNTLQGAGGVGGLLAESIHSSTVATYYPTYDGNGNVSEYLATDGTVTAHFEHDPFGNTVVASGSIGLFDYRFSTKPRDSETGFFYYGYRYYEPVTGRWPARDPIEELGGINLYGMLGNNGINQVDKLGRNPGIGAALLAIAVTLADSQMDQCANPKPTDDISITECENCMTRWYVAGVAAIGGGVVLGTAACVGTGPFAGICAGLTIAGGIWAEVEWKDDLDEKIEKCSCEKNLG